LPIENIFSIEGRGTVVTGKIERGRVRAGDDLEVVGLSEQPLKSVCTQVETFGQLVEEGLAGDSVGCLLRGVRREQVERGQIVVAPGTLAPRLQFEAEVYALTKEEGGRHTPFFSGYTPQFFVRTSDAPGRLRLLGDVEMCLPGDNARASVELVRPLALEAGDRFVVREGGRSIGRGLVSRVLG
jgi:elongation factor Tu